MELDQINKAERALANGQSEFDYQGNRPKDWALLAALGIAHVAGISTENEDRQIGELADIIKVAYEADFASKDTPVELIDMAKRMKEVSDKYDALDDKMKMLNVEYDALRLRAIPDKMAELDIKTVTYDGIGRVQVAADCYASIPAEKKSDAFSWLRSNAFGDLIVENVNPSTLKAFAKEQMKAGNDLPEDLFKVTPFSRASIVKK